MFETIHMFEIRDKSSTSNGLKHAKCFITHRFYVFFFVLLIRTLNEIYCGLMNIILSRPIAIYYICLYDLFDIYL